MPVARVWLAVVAVGDEVPAVLLGPRYEGEAELDIEWQDADTVDVQ
jgi:hypothetical protein